MVDFIIGGLVLLIFATLLYTLFFRKKKDGCSTSVSCTGCSEANICTTGCAKCTPEELKKELQKALRE